MMTGCNILSSITARHNLCVNAWDDVLLVQLGRCFALQADNLPVYPEFINKAASKPYGFKAVYFVRIRQLFLASIRFLCEEKETGWIRQ